jgi:hypothetical protein
VRAKAVLKQPRTETFKVRQQNARAPNTLVLQTIEEAADSSASHGRGWRWNVDWANHSLLSVRHFTHTFLSSERAVRTSDPERPLLELFAVEEVVLMNLPKELAGPTRAWHQQGILGLSLGAVKILSKLLPFIALRWSILRPSPKQLGPHSPLFPPVSTPTLALEDAIEAVNHLEPNWFVRMVQRSSDWSC